MAISRGSSRRPVSIGCFVAPIALILLNGCSSEAVRQCSSLTQLPGKLGYTAVDEGELSPSQFEDVAKHCTQTFERTGDSTAGLAAAKAHFYLRRDDAVLVWVERLRGTPQEAGILGIVAAIHERRNELKLERNARERVVQLRLAANDHREASRAYYYLFLNAVREANFHDQIEFLRLSYEQASKAGSRNLEVLAVTALISPLLEIGDLNSARRVLKTATALTLAAGKTLPPQLPNYQGIVHLREGQHSLATAAFKQALDLALKADDGSARSVYLNLLEASVRTGKLDDAEAYLESAWRQTDPKNSPPPSLLYFRARVARAREQYRAAKDTALTALAAKPGRNWGWQLEYELGRAQEGLGDVAAADAAFTRAIGHVEELRRSVNFDDFKFWLLDRRRDPYEALFRLSARAGSARRAIEILERAKARTFLDAFIRAASTRTGDSEDFALLNESTERLDDLQSLLPAMSKSAAAEVRPIETILNATASKNVLAYFEAEDEVWLVSLLQGRIRLHRLSTSPEALRVLVDRFLTTPDEPAAAARLGDTLVPTAALPSSGGALYIVTDGSLGRLPFASLRPRGRILVHDHPISYVPSLNALYAADTRPSVEYGPAVVLGDPRGDLPAAAREAAEVASRFGVTPLVGRAATLAQLEQARYARVLHIATHTGLGARGAWLAAADGDIAAAALIGLSPQPRLAVLATCASAAREGSDMWGSLGSAFLAGGSKAVLASLWSVRDSDAREFMTRFYTEGGAEDSISALARTQRAFIDSGKPASFWAPYVHFGSSLVAQPHRR